MFTCQCISIANPAELSGTLLRRLYARELNGLITGQTFTFQYFPTTDHPVFCIRLKPSNEKYSFVGQLFIPAVVIIAFVYRDNASLGKIQ